MKVNQVFETVLYSEDLEEAKKFYAGILKLDLIAESELFLAFRFPQSVLLVFNSKISGEKNRPIPSHGTSSNGHIAFAASQEEIEQWKDYFEKYGVEIEKMHDWEQGGTSLYIRDPAGNSVEFAPPTLWGGKWNF